MGGFDGSGEEETLEQRFAELENKMRSLLQDFCDDGFEITTGHHPKSRRPFISVYFSPESADFFSLPQKLKILAQVNQAFSEETLTFESQVYPEGGWSIGAVVLV